MNDNPLKFFIGWSYGYQYTLHKSREDAVKQGKNFYISAFWVSNQIGLLCNVIANIADIVLKNKSLIPIKIACNICPLIEFPFGLLAACIKKGDYLKLANHWNNSKYLPGKLPLKLNQPIVKISSVIATQLGNINRISLVAAAVTLIFLKEFFCGGAILFALGYQVLDSLGFVPRKISLFIENYMPAISIFGVMAGGTLVSRTICALVVPTVLFPSWNRFLHQKIDLFFHRFFGAKGPTLKEIEAPLVERKGLKFSEILSILNQEDIAFRINPAHCSKSVSDLLDYPEDSNFSKLENLFSTIDWEAKASIIIAKFKDDDRFIDFLMQEFPGVPETQIKENVEDFLDQVAAKKGLSPEQFVVEKLHKQMRELTNLLNGLGRVRGLQQDFDDAIKNCKKILPYLLSLNPLLDDVELEDALLKLAIEGGGYCARGIKRVSSELLINVILRGMPCLKPSLYDPVKNYELKLKGVLQEFRYQITELVYDEITNRFMMPSALKRDVQQFDIYRLLLVLGFYPLTQSEKEQIGIIHLAVWEFYANIRERMYALYKQSLDTAISQLGFIHFGTYLRQIINANPELTASEKDHILEMLTERNNDKWTIEETHHRFTRLIMVMLGVLKEASNRELV